MGLLLFLAFQFSSWILIALFLVFTGIQHPPPLNDRTPLDVRRKVVAALVLVVFVVTLVPVPLST
jgi:membrane-associated protease RseP (regulator of RpoE activity)